MKYQAFLHHFVSTGGCCACEVWWDGWCAGEGCVGGGGGLVFGAGVGGVFVRGGGGGDLSGW